MDVRVYRYVWNRNYLALDTCFPLANAVGHTVGRVDVQFGGTNGHKPRYRHVQDTAWRVLVRQAWLSPQEGLADPVDWDSRVKISMYPGSLKGTTDIKQGNLEADPLVVKYCQHLDFPYVDWL